MNNDKFKKLDVARSYRVKYGMEMPTLKLARIMYNDCPTMFTSVETCRTILRKIEGKNGVSNLKYAKDTEFFMEEERPRNPYNLPQSFEKIREPFVLPPECNNILYGSDHHFPYQNNAAIEAWMQFGVENDVNCIFLNGDLMDFHQISRHEKDPRKRSVKQEFEATDQFLLSLRKTFPYAKIYWLKGNHDIRWEKFLLLKAHEIWDDSYFFLEQRLTLNQKNITMIDDKLMVMAGKLMITHGHVLTAAGKNPAEKALNKAGQSVVMGHLHRYDYFERTTAHKETKQQAWVIPCLCELQPDYNVLSNSQHGFAHIRVNENGDFNLKPYIIENGIIQ
jgi:predicted phosphodiesterase